MILYQTQPKTISPYVCKIPLGSKGYTIIDPDEYYWLNRYRWRLKRSHSRSYAVHRTRQNGKELEFFMHRLIAETPPEMDCHHINHDTLDNRKANLVNLTPADHSIEHGKTPPRSTGSNQHRAS